MGKLYLWVNQIRPLYCKMMPPPPPLMMMMIKILICWKSISFNWKNAKQQQLAVPTWLLLFVGDDAAHERWMRCPQICHQLIQLLLLI